MTDTTSNEPVLTAEMEAEKQRIIRELKDEGYEPIFTCHDYRMMKMQALARADVLWPPTEATDEEWLDFCAKGFKIASHIHDSWHMTYCKCMNTSIPVETLPAEESPFIYVPSSVNPDDFFKRVEEVQV